MPKKKLPKKQEELILIRKAQRGDEDALVILLDRYRVSLRVFAKKCLKNIGGLYAEDAVQEVSIRICKSVKTFDSAKGAFSTWVHKITEHVCIEMFTSWQGEEDERVAYSRKLGEAGREEDGGRVPKGPWSAFTWWGDDAEEARDKLKEKVGDTWDHYGEVDPVLKAKNEKILQRMDKWQRRGGSGGGLPFIISPAERATLGESTRPPKLSPREERILRDLRMGTPREEIAEKEKTTPRALKTVISRINKKFSESVTSKGIISV